MAGYYGGYMGNEAGMIAGSPGYFPSDQEIQDRLFNYGMQNTPAGKQIQENIKKLQQTIPPGLFRKAQNLPGEAGNMAGVLNAGMFMGPQIGQIPAGFQNKIVT